MRMMDRRRMGGVAAVIAAFGLGFVCGGGLPGAAAMGVPWAQPPERDPAAQPPEEPAPAAQPPDDPEPSAEPAEGPDAAADEAVQTDADSEVETAAETETPEREPPLVQDRPREFSADTGLLLYFVSPEGESAFEETMRRAAEALAASESEERRAQAEGWRVYRAEEPLADGVLLYLSWLDPAVPGADYWIPDILDEAFPTEAQALYDTYAGAFADGQILLNLRPVAGP